MTMSLQIALEDLCQPEWRPLYVGDRTRYATATSVRIVDPKTIVCGALLARKIYLACFDLEGGRSEVLSCVDTTYAGSTTETDLCDTDGHGHIVTSNCELGSMSLYRREGAAIRFERDLPTGLVGNFCHGARFCGTDVVVATALRDPRGAHFFDVRTMRELLYVKTDRLPKDIGFLSDGRAVLLTTDGAPLPTRSRDRGVSEILLVEFDLHRGTHRVVAQQTYDAGQLDAIAVHGDRLYATDSAGGRVLVIDACTLQQVDLLGGYDVPHGVDVNYGVLAVACYGTNAIHLRSLTA